MMMKQLVMEDGGWDVEIIGVAVVVFTILRIKIKGNVYYLLQILKGREGRLRFRGLSLFMPQCIDFLTLFVSTFFHASTTHNKPRGDTCSKYGLDGSLHEA